MHSRFTTAVLLVSGLGALGLAMLLSGARRGGLALGAGGALLVAVAVVGVIALSRVVAVSERGRRRR